MAARTVHQWFAEYGESHQHPTNTLIHWICVPAIFLSIIGLLFSIPVPGAMPGIVAYAATALALLFYLRLSVPLFFGLLLWCALCLWVCRAIHLSGAWPLWAVSLTVFVLAWIGQFYGHQVEGKKPSFLKDVQFLLIGPAWLMGKLFRRLGIAY
ncbi:MAG TPA: Mpo1-like protein [Flavobacteriales bacterium]